MCRVIVLLREIQQKLLKPLLRSSVLLIHGKNDADVPWTQSESYVRAMAAKGVPVQNLWLPGDHYSIIDVASDDWLTQSDAIRDWL